MLKFAAKGVCNTVTLLNSEVLNCLKKGIESPCIEELLLFKPLSPYNFAHMPSKTYTYFAKGLHSVDSTPSRVGGGGGGDDEKGWRLQEGKRPRSKRESID